MISPFVFKLAQSISAFLVVLLCLVSTPDLAVAQDQSSGLSAKERYEQALLKGRELAKECRVISLNFFDSSYADSHKWKEKWPAIAKKLADHKLVIEKATIDWFIECENPPTELLQIASAVSAQVYDVGDLETTWRMLEKIKRFYPDKNDIILQRQMALVAIKTNRFEYAEDFLSKPDAKDAIEKLESQLDKNLFLLWPMFARKWKREKELRAKEAQADDLPRVKLEITTGDVVVELFENEAPETVANFISLVESGFYDGSVFHPVMKNIAAQAGIYNRSHNIFTDYVIKNESRLPNARCHFAGSLTMASAPGGVDSASSAFAVTLVPNPDLDWEGTEEDVSSQPVFGRVVSGMENLMALTPNVEFDTETDEQKAIKDAKPQFIEKATVIRKRDHDYSFEKIPREQKEE